MLAPLAVICSPFVNVDLVGQREGVLTPEKTSFTKCWDSPAAILADAGIAADHTFGYFAVSEGKVVALDLASGKAAWTSEIGGNIRSDITVSDGLVFIIAFGEDKEPISSRSPVLRALSAKTGLPNWSVKLASAQKYFIEPADGGVLVISSDGTMFQFERTDGRIKWKSSASGPVATPPRLNGNRFFVATIGKVVDEFELSDGRRVASVKTEATPAYVGAGDDSTAVYSDQKGVVYSIKTNGTKNWKFRAGGRIVFVKPVNENVLLGSADNFIYFMSVDYGNLLWKRRLPGRIANGELIGNNLAIFTVVGENSAYLIELEKGRLVNQISLANEDAFLLTPIGANGTHLLAATQKGISAFSLACSNEKSGK
jgi:outer membrane protein assembly factor BamB